MQLLLYLFLKIKKIYIKLYFLLLNTSIGIFKSIYLKIYIIFVYLIFGVVKKLIFNY